MEKIVCMGRGGSGKTSFVALMTKYFLEKKITPLLLVDVDPDQNLGEAVGVDLKEEGKKTISELLMETFLEGGGTTVGVPPSERIEGKIWEKGLFEGEYFDLIAVGTKFIEGCYCLPDAALKKALESLTKTYKFVLIDSPAGLEHLNRRIASHVNKIFDIIDPSKKSFNHVRRAYKVAKEVGIQFEKFYVVSGYRVPEKLEIEVKNRIELPYLGKISHDKDVEQFALEGESLLKLPSESLAFKSVKNILMAAKY